MDHGRKPPLGVAKLTQQPLQSLEAEIDQPGMQRLKTGEQGRNAVHSSFGPV